MAKTTGMKNAKISISVTAADGDIPEAQNTDLNQTAFEALDWQQIGNVGNLVPVGLTTEFANYDELDTAVRQYIKTVSDAGQKPVQCREVVTDKGQIAAKAAGQPTFTDAVAVKVEFDDMPSGGTTNTIIYSRALISGPDRPGGGVTDFQLLDFTFAYQQAPVEVVAA